MEIKTQEIKNYVVIKLHKNTFEKEHENTLQTLIREIVSKGAEDIIIDFKHISTINNLAMTELIIIQKMALFNHLNIKIYSLQPVVANMFFQSGLNKFFDICTTQNIQIQEELDIQELIA